MRATDSKDYRFFKLVCPACGQKGKVWVARLDRHFTCASCRAVFHVTHEGVVLGERPAQANVDDGWRDPDWLVAEKTGGAAWRSWPRHSQLAVLGGVLVVAALVAVFFTQPFGKAYPGSLEERCRLIARALATNDEGMLADLSLAGTRNEAQEWMSRVRSVDWIEALRAMDPAMLRLEMLFQNSYTSSDPENTGKAGVLMVLPPAGRQTEQSVMVEIVLFWVQDDQLDWWLDGERTLREGRVTG